MMTSPAHDFGPKIGPPGLRASYAPDYYGAYVRDLDGNKLHFVRRGEK
jgi:hypothetical protein